MNHATTNYSADASASRLFRNIFPTVPQLTVGQRLKDLRWKLEVSRGQKVTQDWVAEQVGASKSSVAQWETDVRPPGGKYASRLAELYGTTAEYILKGVTASAAGEGSAEYGADVPHEVEKWLDVIIAPDLLRRIAGTPTYRDVLLSAIDVVARRQWPAERKTAVMDRINRMLEDLDAQEER